MYIESDSRLVFTFPTLSEGVTSRARPFTQSLDGPGIPSDSSKIFPSRTAAFSPILRLHKSFSCNTYGSPRKCCKQKTYVLSKSFRCNTYKKQGGTSLQAKSRSLFRQALSTVPYLVTSLLPYLARLSLRGRILGQRAKTEVVRPPRGVNSPRTTHHSGRTAATISRRILFTAFS